MAGQPKAFERLCRRIEDELGGEEWLWAELGNGKTVKQLADEQGVSRHALYKWVKLDPKRHQKFLDFREERADALAEQALDIVDTADENSTAGVQSARNRAEMRKWLAGSLSGTYANKQGQVQINIAELHLDALKAKGLGTIQVPAAAEPDVIDAEVIPEALPAPGAPALADLL